MNYYWVAYVGSLLSCLTGRLDEPVSTVKRRLGQSPVLTRISLSLVEKVFEPADWTSRFPLLGGGSDNFQFLHVENGLITYFWWRNFVFRKLIDIL